MYVDNQACIAMAERDSIAKRAKHIGLRYAFIREAVSNGSVELRYVETQQNVADVFTKPLPHWLFCKHRAHLVEPAPSQE